MWGGSEWDPKPQDSVRVIGRMTGKWRTLPSKSAAPRICSLILSAFIASAGAFTAPHCLAPALAARKGGSFAARVPVLSPAGALSRSAPSTLAPTLPLARQCRLELTAPKLGMETVFQIDNYLTLPFWAMMIFAPKARITRSIMNGWLPFVPLIFVYSEFPPTLVSPPPSSLLLLLLIPAPPHFCGIPLQSLCAILPRDIKNPTPLFSHCLADLTSPSHFLTVYTLASSLSAPGALDIFKGAITLKSLSVAAQQPSAMAAIWAHLVTADLFVGQLCLTHPPKPCFH